MAKSTLEKKGFLKDYSLAYFYEKGKIILLFIFIVDINMNNKVVTP